MPTIDISYVSNLVLQFLFFFTTINSVNDQIRTLCFYDINC